MRAGGRETGKEEVILNRMEALYFYRRHSRIPRLPPLTESICVITSGGRRKPGDETIEITPGK